MNSIIHYFVMVICGVAGENRGTLTLYRYGVKIVIFNDGHDFRSFRWSCDTRLALEKVWQQ